MQECWLALRAQQGWLVHEICHSRLHRPLVYGHSDSRGEPVKPNSRFQSIPFAPYWRWRLFCHRRNSKSLQTAFGEVSPRQGQPGEGANRKGTKKIPKFVESVWDANQEAIIWKLSEVWQSGRTCFSEGPRACTAQVDRRRGIQATTLDRSLHFSRLFWPLYQSLVSLVEPKVFVIPVMLLSFLGNLLVRFYNFWCEFY